MSSDPKASKRWIVPTLVLLNAVVAGAIFKQYTNRQAAPEPPPTAPAPPQASGVDWSQRFAADAAADQTDCSGCNLLLVSLDIFRPDHMPCQGYPVNTTPNICDMVDHGTLLDNFIVHAYQTPVSQMSIFTGHYPSSSGFESFSSVLPPDMPYFPEALQAAGYHTVAMGSSFEVMSDMSSYQEGRVKFFRDGLNPGMSFGRGFDRFIFTGNRNIPTDAIPWIEQNGDQKFFLWLILGTLHWPYGDHAEQTERTKYDPPGYSGPLADSSLSFGVLSRIRDNKLYRTRSNEVIELGPEDGAYINARYDVGMNLVDGFIGDLMTSLSPEVLQNTVIALHGVHGEDLGEHGYFGHYDVFDTEVRESLILLNPRQRVEGMRIKEQVEGIDLVPTLHDILDLGPPPKMQGESFVKALQTGKGDPEALAFSQRIPLWEDIFRHRNKMPHEYVAMVTKLLDAEVVGDTAMRTLEWKLIHRTARDVEAEVSWFAWLTGVPLERQEWELYDLTADPSEQTNVIDEHPEVADRLKSQLLAWESAL